MFTMDFVSAVGLAVTLGVAHVGQADTTAVGAPEVTGAVARSVAWNIGKRMVEKRRADYLATDQGRSLWLCGGGRRGTSMHNFGSHFLYIT